MNIVMIDLNLSNNLTGVSMVVIKIIIIKKRTHFSWLMSLIQSSNIISCECWWVIERPMSDVIINICAKLWLLISFMLNTLVLMKKKGEMIVNWFYSYWPWTSPKVINIFANHIQFQVMPFLSKFNRNR